MHSICPHHSKVLPETIHKHISLRPKCTVIIHTGEAKLNISLYNTIVAKQQNSIRFSIAARDLFYSYTIISVPEALILKHLIIRKVFKRKKEYILQSNLSLNSHFQSLNTITF